MCLINSSKQWFVKIIKGFKRPLSYEEQWKNIYFTKEIF